jgi:nitrate reductase NapE component
MKPVASGLWFGAAACLKAIPGLVLLLPLVRRDWRVFAGAALAAFLFLGVLPLLTVGLDGTIEFNRKTIQLILAPGATGQADETRAKELFQATSTDNQSFQAMINAWYHPNFWTRPNEFHPWAKRGHWILSFALLALTVFGLIRNGMPQPVHRLLGLGLLATVMLLMTPVSHMHYYAFALPLVSGLWIHGLLQRPGRVLPPWATMIPLLLWCTVIATSLIPIPYWKEWRQYGTCTIATTLLWLVGFVTLVRNSKHEIRSTKFERKTSLFQVTLSRNS